MVPHDDRPGNALQDLRRAWARDGWRTGGQARNEMIGEGVSEEDVVRVLDSARILAVLQPRRARRNPTYVLQGRCTEGGLVCLLCRRTPRRVVIDHCFRSE